MTTTTNFISTCCAKRNDGTICGAFTKYEVVVKSSEKSGKLEQEFGVCAEHLDTSLSQLLAQVPIDPTPHKCDLPDCGRPVHLRPVNPTGQCLPLYDMTICFTHLNAYALGWPRTREHFVLTWLDKRNMPFPKRNSVGLFPLL
ncbi:hypothetical protein [Rudaea sp. 3F27F6]|uniref:hypothetical protein n=1 Tax=Rudaea sp. 3F27F6 TaxID=2502208 RepID=UPI0010F6D9B4|nr:hypothetical protein [Rudaea sp. 3F27F6]